MPADRAPLGLAPEPRSDPGWLAGPLRFLRCRDSAASAHVATGAGRPSRYPCPNGTPRSRSVASSASVSMPSAIDWLPDWAPNFSRPMTRACRVRSVSIPRIMPISSFRKAGLSSTMWWKFATPEPASSTATRTFGRIWAIAAERRSVVGDRDVLGDLEHDDRDPPPQEGPAAACRRRSGRANVEAEPAVLRQGTRRLDGGRERRDLEVVLHARIPWPRRRRRPGPCRS